MNIIAKLIDKTVNIVDSIIDKRVQKIDAKRNEFMVKLGELIAKDIYDSTDKLEYFKDQLGEDSLYKVHRFTIKAPWMSRKDFRLLTDDYWDEGGQFNHEVGGTDSSKLLVEVNKNLEKLDFDGILKRAKFSQRRVGIFRDFDGYNIYLELFREYDIKNKVIDEILATFKNHSKWIEYYLNNKDNIGMKCKFDVKFTENSFKYLMYLETYHVNTICEIATDKIKLNFIDPIRENLVVDYGIGVRNESDHGIAISIILKVNKKVV